MKFNLYTGVVLCVYTCENNDCRETSILENSLVSVNKCVAKIFCLLLFVVGNYIRTASIMNLVAQEKNVCEKKFILTGAENHIKI